MSGLPTVSALRLAATGVYLLSFPALQLWLAGDWRWPAGWAFGLWFVAICAACIAWLYRHDPALLAERYRAPGSGGQSRADARIVYGIAAGFLAWIVVPPLDARRFGWTPHLPPWLPIAGAALLLGAAVLLFRSFTDNTFLSPLVRIQSERRQRVVTTGVYAVVRHPMYLGASLMFLGAPLLLASAWGLAVGGALVALLAVRIAGEEKLLSSQLEGYDAYRNKVRYRLIPHVW